MGEYIHFTEEQKYRANSVDLPEFLKRQGEKLIPSGRDKRLETDHSITVRGNTWYDHAAEKGGLAIDFVRHHYGDSFPQAMLHLLNGEQGQGYRPAEPEQKTERKPFELSPANKEMRRTYAYLLQQRCLDRGILAEFARQKLVYESCEKLKGSSREYHNAVFVGTDENGVARHAHKRSIYTLGKPYKGNVDSSDPRYSFHYAGPGGRLFVFEAPIDLLSYISLHPQSWQEQSYVSLCGTAEHAMLWMLEQYPQLQTVSLCLDNDKAGYKAAERLRGILAEHGYTDVEKLHSVYKDWNEDLQAECRLMMQPQSNIIMQ